MTLIAIPLTLMKWQTQFMTTKSFLESEKRWAIPILQIQPSHLSYPYVEVMFVHHLRALYNSENKYFGSLFLRSHHKAYDFAGSERSVAMNRLEKIHECYKAFRRDNAVLDGLSVEELLGEMSDIAEMVLFVHGKLGNERGGISWLPPPGRSREVLAGCLEPDQEWNGSLSFAGCISISILKATSIESKREEGEETESGSHGRFARGESTGLQLAGEEVQCGFRRRHGSRDESGSGP